MKSKFIQLLVDMNIIKQKEDISDTLANFYIKSATDFVMYYVGKQGWDEFDYQDKFESSILNIAIYMYQSKKSGTENIASKTQGNRSISYRGFDIPVSYYQNLPRYPRIWGDSNMINDNNVSCNQKCADDFFNQCV